MSKVVYIDFKKYARSGLYSADVYSHDRKKYQFETQAINISDAYECFIQQAQEVGVGFVRSVAIYVDPIVKRKFGQSPLKIWQYSPAIGDE